MKRILISLSAGLLIVPLLMLVLLAVKIFSPNTYPPAFLWIFLWSYPLLRRIPYLALTGWRILLFGLVGDYLIFSFLIYLCLNVGGRLLQRKVRQTPLPPPPQPFADS